MQVLSKELKEHGYYKKKGVIDKLASKFVGQVAMLDSGDILQVRVSYCGRQFKKPSCMLCSFKGEVQCLCQLA